jgi:hypothetical protein
MRVGAVSARPEAQGMGHRASVGVTAAALLALGIWGLVQPRAVIHFRASIALVGASGLLLIAGLVCSRRSRRPEDQAAPEEGMRRSTITVPADATIPRDDLTLALTAKYEPIPKKWTAPVDVTLLIATRRALGQAPQGSQQALQREVTRLETQAQRELNVLISWHNTMVVDVPTLTRLRDATAPEQRRHMNPATARQAERCHPIWCHAVSESTALRDQMAKNIEEVEKVVPRRPSATAF